MRKLVFVVDRMSKGGAERVVAALANEFTTRGIEVHILTWLPREENEYFLLDGIIRHSFEPLHTKRVLIIYDKIRYYKDTIDIINPDCVLCLGTPRTAVLLSIALKKRNMPLIISERNDPNRYPSEKIIKKMRDIAYSQADGIVFQTKGARDYFEDKIAENSTIIVNPITGHLPEYYNGIREKRIVNFCRIEAQKNIKLLIDAFELLQKRMQGYVLDIFGEGEEKERLIKYVKDKKLSELIQFKGYSNDIYKEINKCSLFVSSSDYEGISNSMLEAMALGLPVICTDCPPGGAKTVIETGQNGILVPVGDVKKLADAMFNVLSDNKLKRTLSKNAVEIRQKLDVTNIADKWEKYIQEKIDEYKVEEKIDEY